jgi:hypothetical protein
MQNHLTISLRRRAAQAALSLCALVCVLLLGACSPSATQPDVSPETMFQNVLFNPIPANVTNLTGTGYTMQGHDLYLRFNADDDFVADLIALYDYQLIDCPNLSTKLALPGQLSGSIPDWEPPLDSAATVCYRASGYSNTWTDLGISEWALDTDTMTIYFHEIGI